MTIYPNLPIRSKINANKKSWCTSHLKDNTDYYLPKDLGGVGSTFADMCRQSYWWRHSQKNYKFPVKTLEIFAWIFPVKLNYESIVDRGGSKAQFVLKMIRWNIRSSSKNCLVNKALGKHFLNLIDLSKFLAILYHKQTYKGGHF